MPHTRQQRIFTVFLLLLVTGAAAVSILAYTQGGGRSTERWFEVVGERGGGGFGGAHDEGNHDTGEGSGFSLVVDPLQYGVILLFLAVITGAILFWSRCHCS